MTKSQQANDRPRHKIWPTTCTATLHSCSHKQNADDARDRTVLELILKDTQDQLTMEMIGVICTGDSWLMLLSLFSLLLFSIFHAHPHSDSLQSHELSCTHPQQHGLQSNEVGHSTEEDSHNPLCTAPCHLQNNPDSHTPPHKCYLTAPCHLQNNPDSHTPPHKCYLYRSVSSTE